MSNKTRRTFSDEEKRQAVDDYVSGRKTAAEIGSELQIHANMIYRWRAELEAAGKLARVEELQGQGMDREAARKIQQLEDELEEYKKKLAEQIVINDLLKKLRDSKTFRPESELTGLINTMKSSARKKGPAK